MPSAPLLEGHSITYVITGRMPILKSCLCCGLLAGSIVSGFCTTIVYLITFGIYVWWIVEAEVSRPAAQENHILVPSVPLPGYLLCVGYAIICILSLGLLYGLYKKNERILLTWSVFMVIIFFPEMGMVLFMSLYHWKISSTYGLWDLLFYVSRGAMNVLCIVCVYSQYSEWRDEIINKETLKKLENLHLSSVSKATLRKFPSENCLAYQNPTFIESVSDVVDSSSISVNQNHKTLARSYSSASQMSGYRILGSQQVTGWGPCLRSFCSSQSEFNAAMFNTGPFSLLQSTKSDAIYSEDGRVSAINGTPLYSHMPRILFPTVEFNCLGPSPLIHPEFSTQSLDRRLLKRNKAISGIEGPYRTPLRLPQYPFINYLGPPMESKSSLAAESDDFRRYRDVAL